MPINTSVAESQQASAPPDSFADRYSTFTPRVTVGNVTGSALEIREYVKLAAGAPASLVKSFSRAIGARGRRLVSAGADYMDYRRTDARSDIASTTTNVATDIASDRRNTTTLSQAMAADLAIGERLVGGNSSDLALFRQQLNELRSQVALLQAEKTRSGESGSIYMVVSPQIVVTGSSETARLNKEIDSLRSELNLLRQRTIALEAFALKYG